ncbi:outer membrane protein assembly factor BamE [Chitiniphilus eburneus]|uniref:Outer membrane protein assembly factor BamE n=1 Tax=Chitiniphilus eburneus TaxID=2571148 RepID=A0A4U0PDZ2_9NEIS|nr:outer membrane protein assembly factor BamE [Chitiniphilus eburneus]
MKPILLTLTLVGALSGCGLLNAVPHYKLDIPQGNEITADKVSGLKEGMSRNQVRFLLGTPLLTDPFHSDRWDYVYSDAKGGKLQRHFVFTVFFEGDSLVRWQGDTLPAAPDTTLRMTSEPKKEDTDTFGSELNPGSPGTTKDVEVKPIIDKDF